MFQPTEEKRLKKKRVSRKKAANRMEDKETCPAGARAEAQLVAPISQPPRKPHTYSEPPNEAARLSTIPRAFSPTPKIGPTPQPSESVLSPPRGPSAPVLAPPSESPRMVSPPSGKVPPNATWEEVLQFTLNSSILSGTFEDVKLLACSRRSQVLGRVGGVRALHANSALLRRALTGAHLLLDINVLPEALEDADIRDIDASFQTGHHEYLEDSDFEDGEIALGPEEESDSEDDDVEEPVTGSSSAGGPDVPETTAPASTSQSDLPGPDDGSKGSTEAPDVGTHENVDDTPTKVTSSTTEVVGGGKDEERETGSPPEDAPDASNSKATANGHAPGDDPEVPPDKSSNTGSDKQGPQSRSYSGTRTVLAPDMAFRTLRTFIFYAYTGRVAFAPLRSQGLIYQDKGLDASQLPVCSPKSMYRLAAKYGNQPLVMQGRADIQSKLSARNILDELFSTFTSRHPDVQEMELNFLLAHIKHPDVTIRLPWWIERFAQGQLVACADTFGKLIHKLACIAAAPPNPSQFGAPNACPRGCWMPTICTQSRCGTCGYVMT